jgi:hypothetical protein
MVDIHLPSYRRSGSIPPRSAVLDILWLLNRAIALQKAYFIGVDEVELFKSIPTKFILVYWSGKGGRNRAPLSRIRTVWHCTLQSKAFSLVWDATRMSMKLFDIPLGRSRLDFSHLGYVVFVVEAVTQHIPKVS